MPNIDLIPEVYYHTLDPYYVYYDNLPLSNIIQRQELINNAVDNNRDILTDAIGTQGTLSNRLDRSLEEDGSLKTSAINDAEHSIAYHTDGAYNDGVSIIEYVRMLSSERSKISLVADEATSLGLLIETPSTTVLFEDTTVEVIPSPTVTWGITAPNKLQANLTFPTTALHNHYYDLDPVHYVLASPDYKTYKVNTLASVYNDGSLRVYINGIRLSEGNSVYVPPADGPDGDWTLTSFTSTAASGIFLLSRSITASDIIKIDFNLPLS